MKKFFYIAITLVFMNTNSCSNWEFKKPIPKKSNPSLIAPGHDNLFG